MAGNGKCFPCSGFAGGSRNGADIADACGGCRNCFLFSGLCRCTFGQFARKDDCGALPRGAGDLSDSSVDRTFLADRQSHDVFCGSGGLHGLGGTDGHSGGCCSDCGSPPELVSNTGGAIDDINRAIAEISALVSAIKAAADDQSLSISETNQAMVQLEGVTQQNAAMFEETNAVTQSLAQQARHLKSVLIRFETGAQDTVAIEIKKDTDTKPTGRSGTQSVAAETVTGNLAVAEPSGQLDPGWEEF